MKKASIVLSVLFLVCAAFLGGFFTGRTLTRSQVRIAQDTPKETPTTVTQPPVEKEDPADSVNRININTASALELSTLPGIGDVIAQRIVDYRQTHGAFRSVGELCEVEGIGDKRLENLLELITVGG